MIKVAWAPIYVHPLPKNHRFPMEKYDMLPKQLLLEGTLEKENFFSPKAIKEEDILAIHKTEYWEKLKTQDFSRQEELRSGFPISSQLVERELVITGGTIEAALYALKNKVSFNIAGGTHHSYADKAEGFCLLNDMAIASSYLLRNKLVRQILIIDLDVHQGNGTAKIFENESRVYTFSMHGKHNYPLRKEKSDLDVPLQDKISGEEYLGLLAESLNKIMKLIQPDFIFYQAGVDILESDKLGRLGVNLKDCKKRDEIVLLLANQYQIPLTACMGGGYSRDINIIVEAHANTYRTAIEIFG